jgi:hypothetical protein
MKAKPIVFFVSPRNAAKKIVCAPSETKRENKSGFSLEHSTIKGSEVPVLLRFALKRNFFAKPAHSS